MARLPCYETPIHEMSHVELDRYLEKVSGLPTPPHDAPKDVHNQWFVAYIFIIMSKHYSEIDQARAEAISVFQQREDFASLKPYIEAALGEPIPIAA